MSKISHSFSIAVLTLMCIATSAIAQTNDVPEAKPTWVPLVMSILPYIVFGGLLYFFYFRGKGSMFNKAREREARFQLHLDRVEAQNDRIIQLLEALNRSNEK